MCREAEQQKSDLESELRQSKIEIETRFNSDEMQEIHQQNKQAFDMKLKYLKQKNEEEVGQLKDVIVQLESHISQVQEGKVEADRKLLIGKE